MAGRWWYRYDGTRRNDIVGVISDYYTRAIEYDEDDVGADEEEEFQVNDNNMVCI